ncbi:TetR family transcriptional regulator [Adhaeribacter aerolatus]|uniref:TetR family transcriptional regulator n=1 Tax=Adhaeribacter aerolatus TaxID=670289 RepID=A0A512AVB3_9BACT|nr:TetR/AcrR family transcriptional regulator [Adhaeribacter aerolatus]GEO03630.1 TetR family transcriptional regulator [Adhaeribacter aerolatus]
MNKFEQQREQSKQQIEEAALILFAEHGFEKTSIRMIAQRVNISLGLLYNYYAGKDELLKEIFRRGRQDAQVALTPDGDKNRYNDIENHIRLTFKILKQNRSYWKLLHGIRMQSPVIQKLEAEMKAETEFMQKRIEENLINGGIPFPGLEAKLLFATLDGITNHYLLYENYPVDDIANLLILKYREQIRK